MPTAALARRSMPNGIVSTEKAPRAIGPYSQATIAGDLIFTSGQIALDPSTQQLVQGDIRVQTERVMDNLAAVLDAEGQASRTWSRRPSSSSTSATSPP